MYKRILICVLSSFIALSCSILPDSVEVVFEDDVPVSTVKEGSTFKADGVEVNFVREKGGLTAVLSAYDTKVKFVKAVWNRQTRPDVLYLGDQWERGYGDLEWKALDPERIMPWYYIETDRKTVLGCGVMTGCRSFCSWKVSETAVELTMDVRNGTHGTDLGGRRLHMATILQFKGKSGENEFASLRRFCKQMCPQPRLADKPVYGINDWYFAYGHNSDELISSTAEMLSDLLPDNDNKPFFLIDDGWARDYSGPDYAYAGEGGFYTSNSNFPDMKELAGKIREAGFRPGLWMRPLTSWKGVSEDMLLPADPENSNRYFDPTVESVREYIRKCFETYKEWGYDMVKHDFSTHDIFRKWGRWMLKSGDMTSGDWQFHDTSLTNAEVVLQLYTDIRDAAGDDIYLIGCNTISHLGAGLFEIQRIGDDTSGRVWEPTLTNGVNCLAFRAAQHNLFYAADADCVGLTSNVDWRLTQRWMELVSGSGTPLFVSPQPAAMGPEQREALRKAFALASVDHPVAEPLDWLETPTPSRWRIDGEEVDFDWSVPDGTTSTAVDLAEGPVSYKVFRNCAPGVQPDFSKFGEPDASGSVSRIGVLPFEWNEDHVAVLFETSIRIDRQGDYLFQLGADEGAKLFIDGKKVVDNSGPHGLTFVTSEVKLSEGLHSVRIEYFDDEGIQWLYLNSGVPGGALRPVQSSVLE